MDSKKKGFLHRWIMEGELERIEEFLQKEEGKEKVDLDQVDSRFGWSPLVLAINQGVACSQDIVIALLKGKADPNLKIENKSPIEWCALNNLPHIMEVLMKYGGELLRQDEESSGNCLHYACLKANVETIDFLMDNQFPLEWQNENGDTPLHFCAIEGQNQSFTAIIKKLEQRLAKAKEEKEREELVQYLRLVFNKQNREGNTILHEALLNGHQSLADRIKSIEHLDQFLLNNKEQTAGHIENDLKNQKFQDLLKKEQQEQQRMVDKSKLKKQRQERLQKQREEQEEAIKKGEKKERYQQNVDDYQTKLRIFAVLFLVILFILLYALFEYKARPRVVGDF